MVRSSTASYVLTAKLIVHQNEQSVLEKRFLIAERLYNQVLRHAKDQLAEVRKNRHYQQVLANRRVAIRTKDETRKRVCNKELQQIQQIFGLSEYALHAYIGRMRHAYKKHIDSFTAQKIATTVWKSVSDNLYGKGERLRFKKRGSLTSIEGKSNKTGIRFKTDRVEWNRLVLPVKIRQNDLFVQEALTSHRVKYCRIVRKPFRSGWKYVVQLVMEGTPPVKRNNNNGMPRHKPSPNESIGIDIGPSSIATVSPSNVDLRELFPKANRFDKEIQHLQRKLDRSRRATNPSNFQADGTIKLGVRLQWVKSHRYKKTLFQVKNLQRKRSALLKQSHNRAANALLEQGNTIYVENMDFRALMRKAKETTYNSKGKANRKKRFGKSIGYHAPAMFLDILQQKLEQEGSNLYKVNTRTFRASQYDHIKGTYTKKPLSQRTALVGTDRVQRDLYSAFLLMNSQSNLQETNQSKCDTTYANFKTLHDRCMTTLSQSKLKKPSSFGLKELALA